MQARSASAVDGNPSPLHRPTYHSISSMTLPHAGELEENNHDLSGGRGEPWRRDRRRQFLELHPFLRP